MLGVCLTVAGLLLDHCWAQAKARFGGFKAKAQAKMKEAQAAAAAKLAELNEVEEEELEADAFPPLFWLEQADVGAAATGPPAPL